LYSGGSILHTGQLFFPDTIVQEVDTLAPYKDANHTASRITYTADRIAQQEGASGVLTTQLLIAAACGSVGTYNGVCIVANATVGIDSTADYTNGSSNGS